MTLENERVEGRRAGKGKHGKLMKQKKKKKKKKGGEDVKKAKTTGNGRIKIKKGERGKEDCR